MRSITIEKTKRSAETMKGMALARFVAHRVQIEEAVGKRYPLKYIHHTYSKTLGMTYQTFCRYVHRELGKRTTEPENVQISTALPPPVRSMIDVERKPNE